MTSNKLEVPHGYVTVQVKGQVGVRCKKCGRAWKIDRLDRQENRDYLVDHIRNHDGIAHPYPPGYFTPKDLTDD